MTVEYDAVYVEDLDPALPEDSDDISEGNDHIMLIKQVLQNTFPSATTSLVADFNYLNQIPTRISLTNDTESEDNSASVLAMDMNGNRLKNIHDARDDQDVPSLLQVQNLIIQALQEGIYPIGSLYCTRSNANPADILGFGTWQQVSGGIFGAGTFTSVDGTSTRTFTAGLTYGSYDHYVSAQNMPAQTINMGATDANGNPYVTTSVTAINPAGATISLSEHHADGNGSYDGGTLLGHPDGDYNSTMDPHLTLPNSAHNHALTGSITIGNAQPAPMETLSPINVFNIWERTV